MKNVLLAVVSLITLTAVSAFGDDLPHRKAGLWEMKTAIEGMTRELPGSQHCVDSSTDEQMLKMGQEMGAGKCSKREMKRDGSSYIGDSVCDIGGSTITSHTTMSGDFGSAYKIDIVSSFDPPFMGKTKSHTSIEAKYLGDCKADQKPGDIILPNGMKMNMSNLANLRAGNRPPRPR